MTTPQYTREFCEPQYNQRHTAPDRPRFMERRFALSAQMMFGSAPWLRSSRMISVCSSREAADPVPPRPVF